MWVLREMRIGVLLLGVAAFACRAGEAEDIRQCRKLQAEIERYTELRRGGGSAPQMEAWKRARRRKQEDYRERDCRYLDTATD